MEPSNKVLLNIIDHNKLIRKNPLKNIEIAFASNFCNLTLCQMRTYQSIAHKEELTLCNSVPFTSRTANSICNGIRNIAVQAKSECKDEDFEDTQTRELFRVLKFEKLLQYYGTQKRKRFLQSLREYTWELQGCKLYNLAVVSSS